MSRMAADTGKNALCQSLGHGSVHQQIVEVSCRSGLQVHLSSAGSHVLVATTSYLTCNSLYRDMCISTGRKVDWDEMPSLAARKQIDMTYAPKCMQPAVDSFAGLHLTSANTAKPGVSWRRIYFEQTYALSFNGINDYALLPNGVLRRHSLPPGLDAGYTIDIMFLAHPMTTNRPALDVDMQSMIPGGGMLLGLQDREFGRSRRAARLFSFPMLYVGLSGHVYSAVGLKSRQVLADGSWHRITLTVVNKVVEEGIACARLYVDGVIDARNYDIHPEHASLYHLPSYAVIGSGITEGHFSGGSVPVYNCHTFHGLIDEIRVWSRTLEAFEVSSMHNNGAKSLRWCTIYELQHAIRYTHLIATILAQEPEHYKVADHYKSCYLGQCIHRYNNLPGEEFAASMTCLMHTI